MEVVCVTIPSKTFSRFEYFRIKSSELQSRHNTLQCQDTKPLNSTKFVRLYLCKKSCETEFPLKINELLGTSVKDECKVGKIGQYKSLKYFLKSQNDFESTISFFIVGSKNKKEVDELGENSFYTILIANDGVTDGFEKEKELYITLATKETISSEISDILERISLLPLKKISEDCYRLLQNDRKNTSSKESFSSTLLYTRTPDKKCRRVEKKNGRLSTHASTSVQKRFVEPVQVGKTRGKETRRSNRGTTELNENHSHNSTGHELNSEKIYTRSKRRSECQAETGRFEAKRRKSEKKEFSGQNGLADMESPLVDFGNNREDSYEYLLEAILSLYRMSNVPETDKPDVPKQSFKVTEELRDALFDTCPSIKRMGYRYRTFTIYAVQLKSSTNEEMRNNKITSVLKAHGINNFTIIPCEENITPLMHVGAKIEARSGRTISLRSRTISNPEIVRGGTLGCFVKANDDGEQHCLLSKHVADNCSDVYYVADNNKIRLGRILPETIRHRPGSLDISAAVMEEHIDGTGRQFKNLQENNVQGQLYPYRYNENEKDAIFRSGQPVYIRGASTNPGMGEITMPFLECGMPTTLIQIEDRILAGRNDQRRFADKGDSGSIVCADVPGDNVHALSMVVGTPDCSATAERRTYLTIPLSKGLQQLEDETGKKFEL